MCIRDRVKLGPSKKSESPASNEEGKEARADDENGETRLRTVGTLKNGASGEYSPMRQKTAALVNLKVRTNNFNANQAESANALRQKSQAMLSVSNIQKRQGALD